MDPAGQDTTPRPHTTPHMPLPQPPRTPSPLSDDDDVISDGPSIGNTWAMRSNSSLAPFDPNSLSPAMPSSRAQSFSSTASSFAPSASSSLTDACALFTPPDENKPNPFGYETQTYTIGRPSSIKSGIVGQRRGHKYKHSSVSHHIILEPTLRAPLRLPASLPIPTAQESWHSMSSEQQTRLMWCFCHLAVAAWVQWTAQGSLAMTALSHLIFYDAIGAFLSAGVSILSNFEVWSCTSIRHPFGLQRCEVVVGFAMSILLLFMGFDMISHSAGHILEEKGESTAHHAHIHADRVSGASIRLCSALAVISTLVSAVMLQNHASMARSMRFGSISFLPSVLNNPSHLFTISCSVALLFMPILSSEMYTWVDRGLSAVIAFIMCALGAQLVSTLGSMLLMSYNPRHGDEISSILQDIEAEPTVKSVEEAKFWQVHYGLAMANIKLKVRGSEDALRNLRERVQSLVKKRMGADSGLDENLKWEISTQLRLEND